MGPIFTETGEPSGDLLHSISYPLAICNLREYVCSMTIQQAIEKSIEGGWDNAWRDEENDHLFMDEMVDEVNVFLLDPSFWQSLGKAMGWIELTCDGCNTNTTIKYRKEHDGKGDGDYHYGCQGHFRWTWLLHWHSLIDHLADGKDIESYFKEL